MKNFSVADRVSTQITDLINNELEQMRTEGKIEPFQLLAGQLMGLMSLLKTIPVTPDEQPLEFKLLRVTVERLLCIIMTGDAHANKQTEN